MLLEPECIRQQKIFIIIIICGGLKMVLFVLVAESIIHKRPLSIFLSEVENIECDSFVDSRVQY